ncbi:MAG: PHP domain-containing protein [Alphaproteobacteria bacterium]|nr:PHP domain-containing protein [Alphaproteobacteria bacterium]
MKINLHCHTNYSDGDDIFKMALEHKKQGFSAFVVTDHVYPLHLDEDVKNGYSMAVTSYEKFQHQTVELKKISKELNFPCIQGMELALYGEEVLVFGQKATKDIFDYIENLDFNEQKKYGHTMAYKQKVVTKLLQIIKENKDNTAVILCHPQLNNTPDWVLKPLYPLLDGYEFQNYGSYYFTDETNQNQKRRANRPVPPELCGKNRFYNSDAHSIRSVGFCEGNVHSSEIETLDDLIVYIKTPQEQNIQTLSRMSNQRG